MTPESPPDQRNLDTKFAGGIAWTAGAKWATQVFSWASLLAVARLLPPADVGIFEIAGIFFGLTNVLAEFGIGTAVLHMPELDRKVLGQLHLFSLLLSSGIFVVAALAAPAVAWFFQSNHVAFFVATTVGFLITGIQAVPFGLLQRDMDYRKLALLDAFTGFLYAVVAVVFAWYGAGFWALFAAAFSSKLFAALLVCYWKPVPFKWPHWSDIRVPVEMGRQLAISRIASAAYANADGIVVGRTLGPAVLGTYRMAMNLANAPAEKISSLIMRAATPLFANVMNDLPLVRRYYLIIAELLSLAVMPLMLGLAILAPQAVLFLMGAKWMAASTPLQWLCLFMIIRVPGVLAEQVLVSQRLTRFTMRMSIVSFVIMPIAFYLAAHRMGTNGVAAAWVVLSPVTILPLLVIVLQSIHLPWSEYANTLLPAVVGSSAMCVSLYAVKQLVAAPSWSIGLYLAVQVCVGGAVYSGVILCFFRSRVLRYVTFMSTFRKANKSPA